MRSFDCVYTIQLYTLALGNRALEILKRSVFPRTMCSSKTNNVLVLNNGKHRKMSMKSKNKHNAELQWADPGTKVTG